MKVEASTLRALGFHRTLGQINSQQATSAITEARNKWNVIKGWRASVEKLDPGLAQTLGTQAAEFLRIYDEVKTGEAAADEIYSRVSVAHPMDTRFIDANDASTVSTWTSLVGKLQGMVDKAGGVAQGEAAAKDAQQAPVTGAPATAPASSGSPAGWAKKYLTPMNLAIGFGALSVLGIIGYFAFRKK